MFAEKFLDVNSDLFQLMEENNLIDEEEKERFLQFSSTSSSSQNQKTGLFSSFKKKTNAVVRGIHHEVKTCKLYLFC